MDRDSTYQSDAMELHKRLCGEGITHRIFINAPHIYPSLILEYQAEGTNMSGICGQIGGAMTNVSNV